MNNFNHIIGRRKPPKPTDFQGFHYKKSYKYTTRAVKIDHIKTASKPYTNKNHQNPQIPATTEETRMSSILCKLRLFITKNQSCLYYVSLLFIYIMYSFVGVSVANKQQTIHNIHYAPFANPKT